MHVAAHRWPVTETKKDKVPQGEGQEEAPRVIDIGV